MLDISLFSIVHCSLQFSSFFFFNDTATTEIYTLSLHDALPILLTLEPGSTRRSPRTDRSTGARREQRPRGRRHRARRADPVAELRPGASREAAHQVVALRSEEHTSELQSRLHLVCRLLLEKKKNN